jgi:pimeloyl-ACP methyl ester carboxylesterase
MPQPAGHSVRFATIHGYRRAFVYGGRGPALLLIHGIGDSSDSWHRVLPELMRDHTVIAPDLLGHGRSAKPRADYSVAAYANAMRDLLAFLNVERVTVVGHSLGGGVAMQFAYQYPSLCERLVLISCGGAGREVHPLLRAAAAPNADFLLPLLRVPGMRMIGRATLSLLGALGTDLGEDAESLMRVFDALPDGASRRAFLRTLRSVVDWRGQAVTLLDRCYLTADIPTLLIWGARDEIVPVKHAHLVHAAMPASQLEVFDRAGHFPHESHPEGFLRVFQEFLARSEPARHCDQQWRERLRGGAVRCASSSNLATASSPAAAGLTPSSGSPTVASHDILRGHQSR